MLLHSDSHNNNDNENNINVNNNLIVLDQCRELEFPGSYFFPGKRLINHVIKTIKVLDQDSCELQCYLEHNCVGINFKFTGTRNCDLNNSTHKEHDKDLVKTAGYIYHGTNVRIRYMIYLWRYFHYC